MTDFDEDLQKQRRNLILISAALIIFDFADVSIAKVGILGTDLIIGDPRILAVAAWLCWLYFLLRYFQYWRIHNARMIKKTYYEYIGSWADAYLYEVEKSGGPRKAMNYVAVARFTMVERKANTRGGMDETVIRTISRAETLNIKAKAWLHVILVSPHFTDQIFPFIIALLAPLVTVVTQWHRFVA
jgi:hypothetical protein